MKSSELAAQLYLISKETKDSGLFLLQGLSLVESAELPEVLKAYLSIKAGELQVADVKSSVILTEQQKQKIAVKVTEQFKDTQIVFVYRVEPALAGGLQIKVDDNIFELSTKLS